MRNNCTYDRIVSLARSIYDDRTQTNRTFEQGYNQALCDLISLAYDVNYYTVEREMEKGLYD